MSMITDELSRLKERGLLRSPKVVEGADFSSNDYLGFSRHPEIRRRLIDFLGSDVALGSTGSRLLSGHSDFLDQTEEYLASTFGSEATLIFGSGYLANLGVITALASGDVEFFSDELNHASLIDGIRLTRSAFKVFRHNDMNHLEQLLAGSRAVEKVIVTESVFSMDGDQAPLSQMFELAERFGAFVVVDEAHATGVLGPKRLGLVDSKTSNVITIHTCGKALGGYGAFVCASRETKEFLINKSRSLIFTTALPPSAIAQIRFSVELLTADCRPTDDLSRNVDFMHNQLKNLGVNVNKSHIIPFLVPGNENVMAAANNLQENGFDVRAVRSPTVPVGRERLRLTLKSFLTSEVLDSLVRHLGEFQI